MNMWDVIYCLGTSRDTLGGVKGMSSEMAVSARQCKSIN